MLRILLLAVATTAAILILPGCSRYTAMNNGRLSLYEDRSGVPEANTDGLIMRTSYLAAAEGD